MCVKQRAVQNHDCVQSIPNLCPSLQAARKKNARVRQGGRERERERERKKKSQIIQNHCTVQIKHHTFDTQQQQSRRIDDAHKMLDNSNVLSYLVDLLFHQSLYTHIHSFRSFFSSSSSFTCVHGLLCTHYSLYLFFKNPDSRIEMYFSHFFLSSVLFFPFR